MRPVFPKENIQKSKISDLPFSAKMKGKEVIQPQVPLRLPCDDLTHLTEIGFNMLKKACFTQTLLGWFDGRCVQGAGTYSPADDDS